MAATQVVSTDGLRCDRCGAEPYLQASFPAEHSSGGAGYLVVTLCPFCDADDPRCTSLFEWFDANERLSEGRLEEFAGLVAQWLDQVRPATVTDEELHQAIAAW